MLETYSVDQKIAILTCLATVLGAFVGSATSLLSILVNKKIERAGKVSLFAKVVFSKSKEKKTIGFYKSNKIQDELYMDIPIWFEVLNTCGQSRVLRDINLYAYNKGEEVGVFTQIQRIGSEEDAIPLGSNEAYSIVVPSNSTCRFNMEFILHQHDVKKDFNKIALIYYDEKNRKKAYHFIDVENCWLEGQLQRKKEWIPLKKRIKNKGGN